MIDWKNVPPIVKMIIAGGSVLCVFCVVMALVRS